MMMSSLWRHVHKLVGVTIFEQKRNNTPRFQLQWHLKIPKRQQERKKEKINKQIQYTNRKQKEREPALAVSIK